MELFKGSLYDIGIATDLPRRIEGQLNRLGADASKNVDKKLLQVGYLLPDPVVQDILRLEKARNRFVYYDDIRRFEDLPREFRWTDQPLTADDYIEMTRSILERLEPLQPRPRPPG